MFGTTEKIHRAHLRVLCHAGTERVPAPAGCPLGNRSRPLSARFIHHCSCRYYCLPRVEAYARYGKMVETGRSGQ